MVIGDRQPGAMPAPGRQGKRFARVFVPFMGALGLVGGLALAVSLDGDTIDRGFWTQLLTITGVSALPLVGIAVRAPAYGTAHWRWPATAATIFAFVVVLAVIGTCLHQIATVAPEGQTPKEPDLALLVVACGGAGMVLAAVACGAVADFFGQSMEDEARPTPAATSSAQRQT